MLKLYVKGAACTYQNILINDILKLIVINTGNGNT